MPERPAPGTRPQAYGVADGLTDGDADADAEPDADVEPLADSLADPDGEALTLGIGVGLGKRVLGNPAKERAKISTNAVMTTSTHGRASVSFCGGSEPRYPASGVPLASSRRFWFVI